MVSINLWNPVYEGIYLSILISYLLGIVHGITPDEHTWPITFSYSVGSYSVKGGAKAGLMFSSGFTLERAVFSEIASVGLASFVLFPSFNSIMYVIVGAVMAISGMYIAKKLKYLHFHPLERGLYRLFGIHKNDHHKEQEELDHMANPIMIKENGEYRPIPLRLAFVHGLIAGFGFGAFALIIYFVLAPGMPVWLGFVPGLMFGLGTMTMQVLAGTFFGYWLSHKKNLSQKSMAYVARGISSFVLTYGGLAFLIAGLVTLALPGLWNIDIITGLHIHNLDSLGLPFFLVVTVVVVMGYLGYKINMSRAMNIQKAEINDQQHPQNVVKKG